MRWLRFLDKQLKMVWTLRRGGRRSFLVGTAHFFPHSFRASLTGLLGSARSVLFEGPLDKDSQDKVVRAGYTGTGSEHLFDLLDRRTVSRITDALSP